MKCALRSYECLYAIFVRARNFKHRINYFYLSAVSRGALIKGAIIQLSHFSFLEYGISIT